MAPERVKPCRSFGSLRLQGERLCLGRAAAVDQPDVPETDRIAVILQLCRKRQRSFGRSATGLVGQFDAVLHDHAVVPDRDRGGTSLLLLAVKASGLKINIVRLPDERRET